MSKSKGFNGHFGTVRERIAVTIVRKLGSLILRRQKVEEEEQTNKNNKQKSPPSVV